jgi:hypothetical protein
VENITVLRKKDLLTTNIVNNIIIISALDEEHKQAILGECKYHVQPVDADVLFTLEQKAKSVAELKAYQKLYLLFSSASQRLCGR